MRYDPSEFPPVAVTVDVVIFTIHKQTLLVLLIERGVPPFKGSWALPGGFIKPDEDLDAAAARELAEETGLSTDDWHLEQLASYGSPGRDPRMRVVTVAYWAIMASLQPVRGGSDAVRAELIPVSAIEAGAVQLAFDHDKIVRDAVEHVRQRLEYAPLAAKFCPPEFTLSQLREVYDTVWGTRLDPGNFQRSVKESSSFLKLRAKADRHLRGRPAALWSVADGIDDSVRGAREWPSQFRRPPVTIAEPRHHLSGRGRNEKKGRALRRQDVELPESED
ncbi:MAG: NUDIX domain-containing protein [Rhodobacteraceae bacterium]|nr:NUDIX domain-containing protein [Paracoccaceae bacterium]